ncbi:MAG: TniB family NTP-binding protein [Sulfurimonas sp.]|jgi:hypothetical protein
MNYEHIHEDFKYLMNLGKEDRVKSLHAPLWINYPKTTEIIQLLKQIIDRPKKPRTQNLLIIGESNIGKTSIAIEFVKLFKSSTIEDEDGMSIIMRPVLLAQAPSKADEKGLYISILETFWTPFHSSDTIAKLRNQTMYLMRECNVKMLIIDEIHHLLSGTPVQQRTVMNALKSLGNELMIPIVGIGIKNASLILSSSPELARRFDLITLSKWELDKNFRGLLNAFEKRLPLKKHSQLHEKEKATLLYTISEGNLGNLHRLLIECSTYAINENIEEITVDIIKKFKWVKPTNSLSPREILI